MAPPVQHCDSPDVHRALRTACWLIGAAVAALQAWATRHAMNPDGLSYLDLARALLAGDWHTGLNPHWGPLYPALLALGFRLARPGPDGLFSVIHAVNLALFLGALCGFDFLLRELLRLRADQRAPFRLSGPGLILFGYGVCLYGTLELIGLGWVTPDLLVAALVFTAAGLTLQLRRSRPGWLAAVLLGAVLGLGYFAKSIMFVLGVVFIAGLALDSDLRDRGAKRRPIIVAATVFLTISAALIIPISHELAHPSFGTAGALAYVWDVNQAPHTNWQGGLPGGTQRLAHPPARIAIPWEAYQYSAHLRGTYPPWFDPAYWNAGARTIVLPWRQVLELHHASRFYLDLFLGSAGGLATLVAVLAWFGTSWREAAERMGSVLPLVLPAAAALVLYALVHVELRYLGPFAALLWLLPTAVAARPLDESKWVDRCGRLCGAFLVIPIAFHAGSDAYQFWDRPNLYALVAAGLREQGLHAGDRVVNIGIERRDNLGSSFEGYWAYLDNLQIVAEMPEGGDFLCADPRATAPAYAAFASLGAVAAVTRAMPGPSCARGWHQIADTNFYVRRLTPTEARRSGLSMNSGVRR
jgi:hypothetical protein